MQMVQNAVERLVPEIRTVFFVLFGRIRHVRVLLDEPLEVRPAEPVTRAVRVAVTIGVCVMHAMRGHP
jgi:hypothetical protein